MQDQYDVGYWTRLFDEVYAVVGGGLALTAVPGLVIVGVAVGRRRHSPRQSGLAPQWPIGQRPP